MKKRILVISSANVDLVLRTETFPRAGETVVSGGGYSYLPGGKGANAARAAASLGADTVFVCRLGEDRYAKKLLALYESEGIDTRFITVDRENETGMAAVISTPDGESRIIVYPGANGTLSADNVEDAFTSYPEGALVQMEIPEEAILAAGRFAAENGTKLIVDAGPAKPGFPFSKMGTIDIFSPNETECEAYTGICPRDGESALRACVALGRMMKVKNIIIKMGERGAFAYDGKYSRIIPAFRVNAVDSTGAGDVFSAALAVRYVSGDGLYDAVRYACAAGALCASHLGAYAPSEDEVLALMEKIGS